MAQNFLNSVESELSAWRYDFPHSTPGECGGAVKLLSLPLIILTLGLFALVVNGLLLWLTSALTDSLSLGFHVTGFWAALFGSIVVSIVSTVLWFFIGRDSMR